MSRPGSLVTAVFSFAALTIGVPGDFGVVWFRSNTLVLFGAYCIGLGWLTLTVTFLPRAVGVLLIVAGLGWLAYVHPPLAKRLGALAMAPGMVGEGVLTFWLQASIPSGGVRRRPKARRDRVTAAKPDRRRAPRATVRACDERERRATV